MLNLVLCIHIIRVCVLNDGGRENLSKSGEGALIDDSGANLLGPYRVATYMCHCPLPNYNRLVQRSPCQACLAISVSGMSLSTSDRRPLEAEYVARVGILQVHSSRWDW